MVSADFIVAVMTVMDGDSLSATVRIVDCTSGAVLGQLVSSGTDANASGLSLLAGRLANDLCAELLGIEPNAKQGTVPELFESNLGRQNLVRESTKCIVYRYGADIVDPATGQVLGRDIQLLGEGLVRSLNDVSSVADVLPLGSGNKPQHITPGDYVVAK